MRRAARREVYLDEAREARTWGALPQASLLARPSQLWSNPLGATIPRTGDSKLGHLCSRMRCFLHSTSIDSPSRRRKKRKSRRHIWTNRQPFEAHIRSVCSLGPFARPQVVAKKKPVNIGWDLYQARSTVVSVEVAPPKIALCSSRMKSGSGTKSGNGKGPHRVAGGDYLGSSFARQEKMDEEVQLDCKSWDDLPFSVQEGLI